MKHRYILLLLFFSPALLFAQDIVIGNYTFKNMAKYHGEMFRGKPWGKGKTIFPNGNVYEGIYAKGIREGVGTLTKPNGEK